MLNENTEKKNAFLSFLYLRFRPGVGSRRSQKSRETHFYLIEKSLTNRGKFEK